MESRDESVCDFKKFAAKIYQNRFDNEKKIKELLVSTTICSIDDFYKTYQRKICTINSETTPLKEQSTVAQFKKVLSSYEKYPSNLQKSRKNLIAQKELNRTMQLSRAISTTELNAGNQSSRAASPQKIIFESGPPVQEIYKEFRQFRQSLNKFLQELKQKDMQTEYIAKWQKLNTFARDIEKLYGVECQNAKSAFSDEESQKLQSLAVNLEKALYINENQDLFQELDVHNQSQRLDRIEEYLQYWLKAVGSYQEM